MSYREYVTGKSVCLVGPASSLVGRGEGALIDSFEIVARVGEVHQSSVEYRKDYGSRTDILYENLFDWRYDHIDKKSILNEYIRSNMKYLRYAWMVDHQLSIFMRHNDSRINISINGEIMEKGLGLIGAFPEKGFLAILDLLELPIKSLYITGITFFQNYGYSHHIKKSRLKSGVWTNDRDEMNPDEKAYVESLKDEKKDIGGHRPDKEFKAFIKIRNSDKRIFVDDVLFQILTPFLNNDNL